MNFDVLTFSESWLCEYLPDNMVSLNGYNEYRNDRKWMENGQIKIGGGTITYVKDSLQVDSHKWHVHNTSGIDVECQWLELNFELQRNIVLATVYRPPQGNIKNFIKYLENTLNQLQLEKTDIFFLGDFNIDFLDKKVETTKKLEDLIKQWGCRKLINSVTRYGVNKECCIDQIITNPDTVLSYGVVDIKLSDHQLIYVHKKKQKCPQ